jgi:hypothetical protein
MHCAPNVRCSRQKRQNMRGRAGNGKWAVSSAPWNGVTRLPSRLFESISLSPPKAYLDRDGFATGAISRRGCAGLPGMGRALCCFALDVVFVRTSVIYCDAAQSACGFFGIREALERAAVEA